METSDYFALIVSGLALMLSLINLYVSHLRGARLEIAAGEKLSFHYLEAGNLAVGLSVAVSNHGARQETLQRFALLIKRPNDADAYLLEPLFYEKMREEGTLVHDSQPTPVPVGGRSTVIKHVLFRSSYERPDEFVLTPGIHVISVLGWARDSLTPSLHDSFSVDISDRIIAELLGYRSDRKQIYVLVPQSKWRKWHPHFVTEVELAALRLKRGT